MEKIKYIAIYKNNDVIHDNNLYCDSILDLFAFIEGFIKHGYYHSIDDFLEDYVIFSLGHLKINKLKNNYDYYLYKNFN